MNGPTSAMVLGASQTITAGSNDPNTVITWSSTCLLGTAFSSVTGPVTTLTVPTAVPQCFNPVVTITGTLGTVKVTASAPITLSYPNPTGMTTNSFLVSGGFFDPVITGSGFYQGGTYQQKFAVCEGIAGEHNLRSGYLEFRLPERRFRSVASWCHNLSPPDQHGGGDVSLFHSIFLVGEERRSDSPKRNWNLSN